MTKTELKHERNWRRLYETQIPRWSLKKALLEIDKKEKEFTAAEFKTWFRGARLKTHKDYVEILKWLTTDLDSPIRKWKLYWNAGIDGRDKQKSDA